MWHVEQLQLNVKGGKYEGGRTFRLTCSSECKARPCFSGFSPLYPFWPAHIVLFSLLWSLRAVSKLHLPFPPPVFPALFSAAKWACEKRIKVKWAHWDWIHKRGQENAENGWGWEKLGGSEKAFSGRGCMHNNRRNTANSQQHQRQHQRKAGKMPRHHNKNKNNGDVGNLWYSAWLFGHFLGAFPLRESYNFRRDIWRDWGQNEMYRSLPISFTGFSLFLAEKVEVQDPNHA